MMNRLFSAALTACMLLVAVSAHAQSGRIFAGAPMEGPRFWAVGEFVQTGNQTFADTAIVRDRTAQGALKANIIRALEPGFDVTGE